MKYLVSFSLLAVSQAALACATCSGPADAPQSQGMNAAIFTLFCVLSLVGLTFAGFASAVAWRIATYHTGESTPAPLQPQSPMGVDS